ncbi:MAG: class I SAM-dependent methyltransferase [Candidatus Asgardarchaeia archaeon]
MTKKLRQEINKEIAKLIGVDEFKPDVKTFYHYKLIGDILILKLSDDLHEYRKEIAKIILDKINGKIRSVIYLRQIKGQTRQPDAEFLLGDSNTETIYREYGYMFKLDVLKLMLSLGNSEERKRVSKLSNPNELVLDMFAGIGQFTIPVAVHSKPKRIFSVEINPEAYYYLIENVFLNKVDHIVFPILGDSRKIVPRLFDKDMFDRIFMGYFNGTIDFLPIAVHVIKSGGIIHFHDLFPKKSAIEIAKHEIKRVLSKLNVTPDFVFSKIVKSYSPKLDHVVLDIRILKNQ